MREQIAAAARLLRGKTEVRCAPYQDTALAASETDVVYMDPPYQGVCTNRDPRYCGQVPFDEFSALLAELNQRSASYIVSYDGRNDLRAYGKPLPASLGLTHIEVDAGVSSQATLLRRRARTIESLYLSPALVSRLAHGRPGGIASRTAPDKRLTGLTAPASS